MATYVIKKGKDIPLAGKAEKRILESALPSRVAVYPQNFRGITPRLLVKPGDEVQVGTPLLHDKRNTDMVIVSPVGGEIVEITRGEKRALTQITIETHATQHARQFQSYSLEEIHRLTREEIIRHLLRGGVWPCIRQRPFSTIANPADTPKAIFIHAMNTEPLALDVDCVLEGYQKEFHIGLAIIQKLAPAALHVCCHAQARSAALLKAGVGRVHTFSGPHPAGNVSTHIHCIDPIRKKERAWYIRAEDVLRVAALFMRGVFSAERFVAVTGEGARNRQYVKTCIGAPVAHLAACAHPADMRFISGSVLAGTEVGHDGFLCFYDSQVTVIPRGGRRRFLGWLLPGLNTYSFSKTFLSSCLKKKVEVSLKTEMHGAQRAIVLNTLYDDYVPLNILTTFLVKAIVAGDAEEAERLGIRECDEEDFALCAFACPSKMDIGGIIRQGLDMLEKEE